VTIDGKLAYPDYLSSSQLNVLVPADSNTGTVSVVVANANGTSAAVTTTLQAILPGLYVQNNYVLAVRPSDSTIINGTGAAASGYTTSASAKVGDVLEIFGSGFGPTAPAATSGLVFSEAYPTTNTVTVTIGGIAATVLWSGLIAAGLYQINIKVPAGVAVGSNAVIAKVGGYSSQSTALMSISA
jgi:uncharacterized protein (TIGR03437 family)